MEEKWYIEKYSDATRPKSFVIKLDLFGSKGAKDYPMVKICVNKHILFHDKVIENYTAEIPVKIFAKNQILSIELTDKTSNDTLIKNSKIVQDKFLKIRKIYLDGIDIKNYIYTARQKPLYHFENQGDKTVKGDHLFFQGPWKLFYQNPPKQYLTKIAKGKQLIKTDQKHLIVEKFMSKIQNLSVTNTL